MRKKRRSSYLLENLEPRLLFSADLAPMPVDGGTPGVEFESSLEFSLQPDSGGMQEADDNTAERREVIFVDAGVDDFQQLIDDLESQYEKGRNFSIVFLDSDSDGIAQISAYLKQQEDVAAVHIISHGTEGEVVLGKSHLNSTTLEDYAEAIEGWQHALSGDADLLFYGCNLAAGTEGQDLVNSLTLLTNADVAASDDLTGNVDLGGDWDLEYSKGKIETAVAINNAIQQNWNGVLASFTVDTTADTVDVNPGDGVAEDAFGNTSLRAAIMEANALVGADSITLSAGTYSISIDGTGDDVTLTGDLDITSDLTITGMGAGVTVIDGDGLDRVFHIDWAGNATITNLTIQNGGNVTHGGGIRVSGGGSGGHLNLENVIVRNNTASGNGGGIFVDGVVTLNNVEISGNTTSGTGGGLSNDEQATLTGVTISGNSAADGGGIYNSNQGNLLELTNVTVSGNTATANGGGIYTAELTKLTNVTLTSNLGGGGIYSTGGQGDVQLKNSILANNTGGNSNLPLTSLGYNIEDGNSAFTPVIGDQPNTDPSLGPLQNNGGFTQTHALQAVSPAIDPAGLSGAPSQDQRGYARDVTPDIGAFEYNVSNIAPTITSVTGAPMVDEDAVYSLDLTFTDPDDSTVTWTVNWGDGRISSALSTGATTTLTHTYSQPGFTYNILVSANDGDVTVLQNELLVPSYAAGDSIFRYKETTGAFLQEFATANGLDDPIQAIIGPDGNLYVTSEKSDQVLRYNAVTGAFIDEFVSAGSGGLNEPGGLAFGQDGNLYVSSFATDEVLRYDGTSGAFIDAFVTAGSGGLNGPYGLTFGSDGNLYIASYLDSQVLRYNGTTGAFIDVFVSSGSGGLSTPEQMIFGPDGNLYIASFDTNEVLRYNGTTGAFIDAFVTAGLGGLNQTTGLAFGPDGNLYVADHQDAVILRYNGTTGAFIDEYVSAGSGGLVKPVFISFLPEQQVLVNPVNDAPTLSGGPYNLGSTDEDNASTGVQVTTILGGLTSSDADGDTLGIAVVTASGNGTWQYSTNSTDGTDGTWTAFVSVDSSNALLLSNSSWVRYVPDGLNGENVNIDFHAWDGTTGTASIDGTPSTADPAGGGGTTAYSNGTATANLTVTDQNDAPTINSFGGYGVDEDDNYRLLTGISIADVDAGGADVKVTLVVANGLLLIGSTAGLTSITGNDSNSVELVGSVTDINGALATLSYKPNADFAGSDNVSITVDDLGNTGVGGPKVAIKNVSLSVNPVNDAPVVSAPGSELNATEQIGLAIHGTGFSVSDVDESGAGAIATLKVDEGIISVVVGNSGVSIDSGDGTGTVALSGSIAQLNALFSGASTGTITYLNNSDNPSSNTILTVTVNDQGNTGADPGLTGDGSSEEGSNSVTINIASANDAPTINNATFALDENSTNGTAVGNVPVTDPDAGDTHVYSITAGNTGGAFAIDNAGKITVANSAALDFETSPVFTLTVQVRDQGGTGLIDTATITINLSDVATTITAGQTFGVSETTTNGTAVGTVATTGDIPTSFTITGGNTSNAFAIDASGNITVNDATAINYETLNSYTLTVEVNDGTSTSFETITVNVTDVATTITAGQTFGVSETAGNSTVIGTVATTGDAPAAFNITAGNTGNAFAIDASGNITVNDATAINYETLNSYTLTVEVNDGTSTTSETVTINVTDVNEAPFINNATFNIDENSTNGTAVGSVPISDPDAGDTHICSITAGNTGGAFAIDNTGNIAVANSAVLNFETTPVFTLTVQVQDQGGTGLADTATITVNLNNLNEVPVINDATFSLDENSTNGTAVGTVPVTDPDVGDTHVYSITAGNTGGAFAIDNAGNISVANSAALDFETTPVFTLTVQVQDQGGIGLIYTATITVNLNNLNEVPVINDATFSLDENSINGTAVGSVPATDPDAADTHFYSITAGNTGDAFAIDNAGNITVVNSAALNFETTLVFTLTVQVQDQGGTGLTDTATVTVNLNDINDAPVISNATFNIDENSTNGTAVGNVPVTDPDAGDTHLYSITAGNTGGAFAIDNAGNITVANSAALNFENTPIFTLTVQVQDQGGTGLIDTATIAVNLNDINDTGTVTIDNTTPSQGDSLAANVIDPDGVSGAINYQWFSDGVVIGGANGKTYTTTQSDVGTTITVTAIYTDDLGTTESLTSAPTAPVTNVNDAPVAVNDNLTVVEDHSMTFTSVTDLLGNDSDMDGDTLTLSDFTQPTNGVLIDNRDGTFTYTPAGNFSDIDSFTYTVSDSNGGTAAGAAIIVVTPVGDTPQVTNVFTNAEVQSGPISIDRNANDGAEVTHFKISGITNGTLYLADGVTPIEDGDFITVGQGQAGLRFTPAENSTEDGSFNVESSEDGVSVASQSGVATSTISILTTAPQPAEFAQSPPLSNPDEVVSEETEQEEIEELEDVTDEAETQAAADNVVSVETPQISKVSNIKKASLVPGISVFKRADSGDNDDRTPDRIKLSVPQTLKMLVKADNLGELKTALGKLDIATLPPDVYELVRGSLDAVQEEMDNEILLGKTVVGSAIATSVGLSAGYVVWMLKGGSLMASVLSSLPAWQLADPLAILVGTKRDGDDDDESLETIIKDGSESDEDKEDDASESNKHKKESANQ